MASPETPSQPCTLPLTILQLVKLRGRKAPVWWARAYLVLNRLIQLAGRVSRCRLQNRKAWRRNVNAHELAFTARLGFLDEASAIVATQDRAVVAEEITAMLALLLPAVNDWLEACEEFLQRRQARCPTGQWAEAAEEFAHCRSQLDDVASRYDMPFYNLSHMLELVGGKNKQPPQSLL